MGEIVGSVGTRMGIIKRGMNSATVQEEQSLYQTRDKYEITALLDPSRPVFCLRLRQQNMLFRESMLIWPLSWAIPLIPLAAATTVVLEMLEGTSLSRPFCIHF